LEFGNIIGVLGMLDFIHSVSHDSLATFSKGSILALKNS